MRKEVRMVFKEYQSSEKIMKPLAEENTHEFEKTDSCKVGRGGGRSRGRSRGLRRPRRVPRRKRLYQRKGSQKKAKDSDKPEPSNDVEVQLNVGDLNVDDVQTRETSHVDPAEVANTFTEVVPGDIIQLTSLSASAPNDFSASAPNDFSAESKSTELASYSEYSEGISLSHLFSGSTSSPSLLTSQHQEKFSSGIVNTQEEETSLSLIKSQQGEETSGSVNTQRNERWIFADNLHDYALPTTLDEQSLNDGVSQEENSSPNVCMGNKPRGTEGMPFSHGVGKRALMFQVRHRLDFVLPVRWHAVANQNGIHVLYVSAQDSMLTQRNVKFSPDGKVGLFVHGQPIELETVLTNCPSEVPLTVETINEFADRIVKIIHEIRQYEVCSGCDNLDYKFAWGMSPLGEIDKNPYGECRYDETFRSFACKRLVKRRTWRCVECYKILRSLKKRSDFARVQQPHPNTPNVYLTEPQKLQKLLEQKRELDLAKKVIARLRGKMASVIESEGVDIDSDFSQDLSDILSAIDLTPAQSIFLQQQIKSSQGTKVGMRWHPTMIRLALSLYITSPSAYRMLQDTGMIKLPSSRTVFDYAHVKPAQEGIDELVLNSVAQKTANFSEKYKKYHVLMADEMYISQNLVFQKSTGKVIGYVNLNDVDQEVINLENYLNNDDEETREPAIAQKILVYMIKGVSSGMKEVVASFAVAQLSVNQMYVWTWNVIRALETSGVAVIAFVSDGVSTNRAFMKKHKPLTKLPNGLVFDTVNKAAPDRVLYFLSDVPHLLKTIRNCLLNSRSDGKKSRRRMERNGKRISWDFIVDLYEAFKKKTLRKAFKLSPMNVFPDSYARMKVKYAADVCSLTVAQDLEDQQWDEASELIIFLRLVLREGLLGMGNIYWGNDLGRQVLTKS